MSALLEFLNEMFGKDSGASAEDVKTLFNNDFGVMVDIEDDLYLFKYDMIMVKWNAITFECRGTVMARLADGSWMYVSRPPAKFFNLREGHCPYSSKAKFIEDFDSLEIVQKADGSAIQMYFWKGEWRISTLGKIKPCNIGDYKFTFSDLFLKLFGVENLKKANTEYCYFHELCSAYNIIVTQYPEDTIFLLLARKVSTGEYMSTAELDRVASEDFGERRPYRLKVSDLPLAEKTLEALEAYVEEESSNERYGQNAEGFVLSNPEPLGKLKNQRYLVLHRLIGGGDKGHTVNNLLDMFFSGIIDDFYSDLTIVQKNAIESLKNKIAEINSKIEFFIASVDIRNIDRKSYAIKVNEQVELKRFTAYLFQRYIDENSPTFTEWLLIGRNNSKNWTKFEDLWKSGFTI
jgi:hypothetical protein